MPHDEPIRLDTVRSTLDELGRHVAAHPELQKPPARERLAVFLEAGEPSPVGRPPKDEDERKGVQTAIRLTQAEVDEIDRVATEMAEDSGLEVSRAAAMRAAITEGLKVIDERIKRRRRKK